MPQFDITSPDGKKFRITAPEGATQEQALAHFQSQYGSQESQPEGAVAGAVRQLKGGVEAAANLATGSLAAPVAGIAGISQGITNLVVPGQISAADRVHQVQNALTYEPKSATGQKVAETVAYPFTKLAEGADKAGGATTDVTGSPMLGAQVNTALQSVPLLLGRAGPAGGMAEAASRARSLKLKNAPADAAVAGAKEAGYSLPPAQVNPSAWNKIVEGVAGKIKTSQDLSLKNQPVTNTLVKQGLGLAEEAPLNAQTLATLRKDAGQAYERVRGSGTVITDPVYSQSLDKIAAPFERAAKDFPDAARTDILDAVKAARRDSFDASSAVDQISILRDKADGAYRAGDKKLGRAYKDISGAMEEQLGRHLETTGASPEAIADFRNARERIAKSYTVEKHLNQAGNVDAKGLAADLKRGKPLSGEIRTAAEFGSNFPKAAQVPEKIGGVPTSPVDAAMGLGSIVGAVASGHPMVALGALAPYARPVLRSAITSGPYQNTFVNPRQYGPTTMDRLRALQAKPSTQMLELAQEHQQ